jgi:hypothetical protein
MSREKCDALIVENDLLNYVCYITEYTISQLLYDVYRCWPVLVNTVLKREFGLQTEEVTEQRNLHNDELLIGIPR